MTDSDVLEPYAVRAVMRTLDILELLDEPTEPVTLAHVVSVTGLPKTSAFRYLATLEHRGYVKRTETGAYVPMRSLSPSRAYDLEQIVHRVLPMLKQLRDRFTETVSLGVLDGWRASYLIVVPAIRSVRVEISPGSRQMVHCTAFGKALAAQLADEEVREMLAAEGMPQLTGRTITDPDRFLHELARVRRAGYAVNNGENEEGARCVAMALATSHIPLAVALSAPTGRLPLSRIREVVGAFQEFDEAFGRGVVR